MPLQEVYICLDAIHLPDKPDYYRNSPWRPKGDQRESLDQFQPELPVVTWETKVFEYRAPSLSHLQQRWPLWHGGWQVHIDSPPPLRFHPELRDCWACWAPLFGVPQMDTAAPFPTGGHFWLMPEEELEMSRFLAIDV